MWNGTGWERALVLPDDPEFGVTYENYRDLPGWSDVCFDCPEWGWIQNEDDVWVWDAPDGSFWSYDPMGNWDLENDEGDEYVPVRNITDLPGYDEDCEECPEWGWEEKADGVWVWNDPLGNVWFPQEDGSWKTNDATLPNIFSYEFLPGWIEECHCEDQGWGWIDVNDDGIYEWWAPNNYLWGELDGVWYRLNPDGTFPEDLGLGITYYGQLPGFGDTCFERSGTCLLYTSDAADE